MAGFVPYEWQARILESTSGRTSVSSTTLYLGLAVIVPQDDPESTSLSTLTEVTTSGYQRVQIPVFDPASTTPPIQITVSSDFAFAAVDEDMDDDNAANYVFMTDAASGTSGVVRYVWELTEPVKALAGQPIKIPANQLIIE